MGDLFSVFNAESLPDGADLLIEAVRFRAKNHTLVRSLSYRAEQTRITPSLSDAEIEKEADEINDVFRRAMKNDPNAHLWVNEAEEAERRAHIRKIRSQPQISQLIVKYKAPSFSRKLLSLQIERQRQNSKKWELVTHVIESDIASQKSE